MGNTVFVHLTNFQSTKVELDLIFHASY